MEGKSLEGFSFFFFSSEVKLFRPRQMALALSDEVKE